MTKPATLMLVSCCGPKLSRAAPAKDLYQSQLFKLARAYAERSGHPWVILSALHGVVLPDQVIEPYDQRMPTQQTARRSWGAGTSQALLAAAGGRRMRYVSLCGSDYTEFLGGPLESAGSTIEYPLKGLAIGQRLRWFKDQLQRS